MKLVLSNLACGLISVFAVQAAPSGSPADVFNSTWVAASQSPAPSPTNSYQVTLARRGVGNRLRNADLFCVFYAGYGHISLPRDDCPKGGRICSVRSENEGRTWSAPQVLFDSPSDDRDPHVAQMRDGSIVCTFFTYRPQPGGRVICDTCLVSSRGRISLVR